MHESDKALFDDALKAFRELWCTSTTFARHNTELLDTLEERMTGRSFGAVFGEFLKESYQGDETFGIHNLTLLTSLVQKVPIDSNHDQIAGIIEVLSGATRAQWPLVFNHIDAEKRRVEFPLQLELQLVA